MLENIGNIISNWWWVIILLLNILFILFLFFSERTDPNKFLIWTLIFIILPVIGFIIYLFIGQTFYADHTFKVKGLKDKDAKEINLVDKELIDAEAIADPKRASCMKVMRATAGPSYSANNDVTLFTDGNKKFESFFNDLRNAKTYIHVEYYILRNDELGNEFMEILTQKAKEGLEVRFLTDYVGIGKGPTKAIKRFKAAGGRYAVFHDLKSILLSPKKNNRNHRKIAVIDGQITYCGGFNIGDEYLGKGPLGPWRDSAVRMVGAVALYLGARFVMDWEYASGETIDVNDQKYLPDSTINEMFGNTAVQIVSGGPDVASYNPIRIQYLEMFKIARKTIWIHTPYLIPNDSVLDILRVAAASGVDVRIIIPDKPDHMFVYWNNLWSANMLMEAGVKVYHYNNGFVHSKTVVVDGEYCSVGSANMDDRSLVLNFETNAMIYSTELGKQMMDAYEEDLKLCTQYSCEEYAKRTKMMKIKIAVSKLFKYLA